MLIVANFFPIDSIMVYTLNDVLWLQIVFLLHRPSYIFM